MADFKYTMKDLSRIIDRTPARIYSYFKEDTEFYFSSNNRRKDNKRGYIYNEAVLERLKNKLLMENDLPPQDLFTAEGESPHTNPPPSIELEKMAAEIERLTAELEEEKGKCAALKADLEKADGERAELLRQNGNLLLLLTQEKAEKQALLPSPRQTMRQRLKSIFKKSE